MQRIGDIKDGGGYEYENIEKAKIDIRMKNRKRSGEKNWTQKKNYYIWLKD